MAVHTFVIGTSAQRTDELAQEVLEQLQFCLRLGSQPPGFLSQQSRRRSGCSSHSPVIMGPLVYVASRTDVAGP